MGEEHTNLATTPRFNVVIVQDHGVRESLLKPLQTVLEVVENERWGGGLFHDRLKIFQFSTVCLVCFSRFIIDCSRRKLQEFVRQCRCCCRRFGVVAALRLRDQPETGVVPQHASQERRRCHRPARHP